MVEGDLILGRWLVGERIGQGGFGVVHRAWDERLDRAVAVKEIVAGDRERSRREAQAAARLNHPCIVTLYELGQERSTTYLVSELVEGRTLRELIDDGAISDQDVAVVGSELCSALAHAHARGVVHRDIKPENVIVAGTATASGGGRGQVKLMDFGIAAIAGAPTLTATGQMVGTLAYIAPEQAEGRPCGPEADVYALALNLYECWAGHNPVARETPAATARAIGDLLPSLRAERPDLPPAAIEVVDACLDPAPHARPSLVELRETLSGVSGALDPVSAVPVPAKRAASEPEPLGFDRAPERFTIPAVLATTTIIAALALIGFGGIAVVAAVLIAPAALLVRSPRAWLLPVLAPVLAAAAFAPLYVIVAALAGRSSLARFVLGGLGVAWLAVSGALVGLPSSLVDLPRETGWADSGTAALGALESIVTLESVALALVWAVGAASLGAVLSLRAVGLRPVLALVWAAGLVASYEVIYGTAVTGSAVDGRSVPLVLAAAVLSIVVVTTFRETHARRSTRWKPLPSAGEARRPVGSLRTLETLPARGLEPPVP